ncbi:MAG: Ig-like domain-containing protein [Proteobacteria bacterium]|nr:Ig-like domain-containing protein [Pseudomonadota bacterium]
MKRSLCFFILALSASCAKAPSNSRSPASSNGTSAAPIKQGEGDATGKGSKAEDLSIFPPKLITGFDGTHSFQAPARATGGTLSKVSWSLSDPSLASLQANADGTVMITSKKAGSAQLTATDGTHKSSVTLTINSYTTAAYTAGETRYKTAGTSGAACASCHAAAGGSAPDHTPTELDADTDDEVANTFISGVDPEGVAVPAANHKFAVTATEKLGLVAYLRALKPSGYPSPD